MRRYNIVSRIILILSVITFALTAPALLQEKRQACVDVVHVPEHATTVLRKRTREQDLDMLWDGLRYYETVWGHRNPGVHLHVPPLNPAEVHVPPQNPAEVYVPEVHEPPQSPADSDRDSMELDDDAPPASPQSGHSQSPPMSPKGSTESVDSHTAPLSPGSSTESDSDSDRWSTISNAPSEESQSENLKAADSEMRGKAKVNAAHMSAGDPGPSRFPQN